MATRRRMIPLTRSSDTPPAPIERRDATSFCLCYLCSLERPTLVSSHSSPEQIPHIVIQCTVLYVAELSVSNSGMRLRVMCFCVSSRRSVLLYTSPLFVPLRGHWATELWIHEEHNKYE